MDCYNVMVISVEGRNETSKELQTIFSEHGCKIRVRLGLPQQTDMVCTERGLIILQICGEIDELETIKSQLNKVNGVKADYICV